MAFFWPWICNARGLVGGVIALALALPGCQFDTSLELRNDPPDWIGGTAVNATLRYPQSTLCTLTVEDLNDTVLDFLACFARDSGDTTCVDPAPWPWHATWSGDLPGTAALVLTVDPCSLGTFFGMFQVQDRSGATVQQSFGYAMVLADSLNKFPISPGIWKVEPEADSAFVGMDFLNTKIKFAFSQTGDSAPASVGLCSRFSLSGDLETGIEFQLRDDMREGFEISFFISTSPLSGPWDGQKTGFTITGLPNHVRFTCTSVNMQTDSRDVSRTFPEFAGYLSIARRGDSVAYQFIPGDPQLPVVPMNKFAFPGDSGVYVHVRMKVTDRLRTRHCLWSDFGVTRGRLRF